VAHGKITIKDSQGGTYSEEQGEGLLIGLGGGEKEQAITGLFKGKEK